MLPASREESCPSTCPLSRHVRYRPLLRDWSRCAYPVPSSRDDSGGMGLDWWRNSCSTKNWQVVGSVCSVAKGAVHSGI